MSGRGVKQSAVKTLFTERGGAVSFQRDVWREMAKGRSNWDLLTLGPLRVEPS